MATNEVQGCWVFSMIQPVSSDVHGSCKTKGGEILPPPPIFLYIYILPFHSYKAALRHAVGTRANDINAINKPINKYKAMLNAVRGIIK